MERLQQYWILLKLLWQRTGFHILHWGKVFGLGNDRAAVLTGHKGEVSALMKKENTMLVSVHCLVHRLALCTSQAATDIPAVKGYQQIITDIYYYFSKSWQQ